MAARNARCCQNGDSAPLPGAVMSLFFAYLQSPVGRLKLVASDVGWVTLVTFLFSLLATLYPAWRASRTQPAQALRYE